MASDSSTLFPQPAPATTRTSGPSSAVRARATSSGLGRSTAGRRGGAMRPRGAGSPGGAATRVGSFRAIATSSGRDGTRRAGAGEGGAP